MTRRRKILGSIALVLVVAVVAFGAVLSHDSPCKPASAPRAGATYMKAITYHCYGSPEVLHLESVEKPVPADDELLVKVRAAGVNPYDWHFMRGKPYVMRLQSGIGAPKDARIGADFAGVVEAVGKDVTAFRAGDAVFGGSSGTFAEYITVRDSRNVVSKPENVSFEQAAGVGIAAITALQALRDKGRIKAGEKVLVNGASGGVGTFTVQLAKHFGAEVTGVCSTRNVEMVKSLGADHVIDYKLEDFTRHDARYDLIIDTVGNRGMPEYRKVLTEKGRYVMVGGPNEGNWIGQLSGAIKASLYSPFVSQEYSMMMTAPNPKDLELLSGLMAQGKITTVIDQRYPLAEVPAAMTYVEEGHARGKVIITME